MKKAIQKLEDYWKSAEKAQTEGKYSYAESIWYAALEEAQELPKTDRRRALVMERLCECLWFQQKFEDAVPLAKELVGIYSEVLGPDHFDTACRWQTWHLSITFWAISKMLSHSWSKPMP